MMDTEEIIRRCEEISLSGEGRSKITFKSSMKRKGEKIVAGCLVGKVLLNREVPVERIKSTLQTVWKTMREVKIEELGENIFLFKFGAEVDKRKILSGGPWHFENGLIILKEPVGIGEITKQDFTHVSFWVQIHNVPIMCRDTETIQELGEAIGRVEEVGTDDNGDCFGKYIRLRISVDVTKPLIQMLELEQEDEGEKPVPMLVRYERLPDFCFVCGCIGHQYRICAKYKNQSRKEMEYGPLLKAPTVIDKKKMKNGKEDWSSEAGKKGNEGPVKAVDQEVSSLLALGKSNKPGGGEGSAQIHIEKWSGFQQSQGVGVTEMSENRDQEPQGIAEKAAPHGKQKNDAGNQKVIERDTEISAMQKEKKEKENEATATEAQEMDLQIAQGLQIAQIEYNTGDINGPNVAVNKPKKRKWKLQARKITKTLNCTDGKGAIKRPRNELHRANPNEKKRRVSSQTLSILTISPSSKEKLKREVQSYGENEQETMVSQNSSMELETRGPQNSAAEAGYQPRRHQ